MQSKYKLFLFDFDGVVLDSLEAKGHAFASLFDENPNSIIYKQLFTFHLENGGTNRIVKIQKMFEIINQKKISDSELADKLETLKVLMQKKLFECKPIDEYIIPTLKEISLLSPMYILSAAPDNEVKALCKNLRIQNYFISIFGNCNKQIKIKELIQELNLNSSEVLFIGDAEEDYKAATANNIDFLLKKNKNNQSSFSNTFKGNFINSFNEITKYL